MKKILLKFALALAFIGAIVISSCEKEPPIPACERDHVGTVTAKNSTGYNIWVDVTWGDVVENYEKLLYNGNSYKYTQIPASGHPESYGGKIEYWASSDRDSWVWDIDYLSPCEDMTVTWYPASRKSTGCPFVLYINGEEVIPKLKLKQ